MPIAQGREAGKGEVRNVTPCRGIGPSYEDKWGRRALRRQDLYDPEIFDEKLAETLDFHNFVLTNYLGGKAVSANEVRDQAMALAPAIKPMVADVSSNLYLATKAGHKLLFDGAQGSLLDIEPVHYPFRSDEQRWGKKSGRKCTIQ